jgi:hypothetical protein
MCLLPGFGLTPVRCDKIQGLLEARGSKLQGCLPTSYQPRLAVMVQMEVEGAVGRTCSLAQARLLQLCPPVALLRHSLRSQLGASKRSAAKIDRRAALGLRCGADLARMCGRARFKTRASASARASKHGMEK